ncbi:MAG TPA: molybdate ABC transporter substrate-binding protein [Ilumatobacter sp.]|nr:molybdate ABC transporter substrate-binding protein [Ilumatobacter sp.]
MGRHSRILTSTVLALSLVAAACGGDDSADDPPATSPAPSPSTSPATSPATDPANPTTDPPATDPAPSPDTTEPASGPSGDLIVFAATSLTAAFTDVEAAFEAEFPDVDVVFNFAGSSALVTQITEGAPADVFASADLNNMTKLTDEDGTLDEPVVFATNLLQIIVEEGNPLGITGIADLANSDLILAICAPEVPCGNYANEIFDNAGITVEPDTLEENVGAVTTKVTAGEADAGIVYATDVIANDDRADGVPIPTDINVIAEYPIAVTNETGNPDAAAAFIAFVLSAAGQAILASYGFTAP